MRENMKCLKFKKGNVKIKMCAACPLSVVEFSQSEWKNELFCFAKPFRHNVTQAGENETVWKDCPLPDWQESEPDIFSAIECLKLALESTTVPEMEHDVRRALHFLGANIGGENEK